MTTKIYSSAEAFKEEFKDWVSEDGDLRSVKEPMVHVQRQTTRIYGQKMHEQPWMGYNLTQLPGCCGVVVSNGAWIEGNVRGNGLGDYFHRERISLSEFMGYTVMMCTTVSSNEAENHILEKNDWKKVHTFQNKRTGNTVFIWIKDITSL